MENEGEQIDTAEQEVHFYATAQQISRRRNPHSRTLQEILLDRVTSDEHIAEIYSCLNDKIEAFRATGRRAEDAPAQINQYLAIKAKLYFTFYRSTTSEDTGDTLGMFEVDQLYELFVDVVSIRDQVKACIYKLHGAERRKTKVDGYLLIFRIEGVLKEITNAAFPSLLYTRNGNNITTNNGDITLTEFELILLQKQLKKQRKFRIDELNPLRNSLLELSDEIQTLQMEIMKEEEALAKVDITESLLVRNQIDVVEKAIRISRLQAIRFTHEVYAYHDRHIHQAAHSTIDTCSQFIEQSPICRTELNKLMEYGHQNKEEAPSMGSYYNYLKDIIHNMHELSKKQPNKNKFAKHASNLLALLQRQLKWNKNANEVLILHENYISALRMRRDVDKEALSKEEGRIASIISKYLQLIMGHFIDRHWSVIYRITAFEEEFTYSLLTTNTIIHSLIEYEDRFTQLIDEFAPQLEVLIQMSKIYLKSADKHAFIQEALVRIYYPSLRADCQKLLEGSQLRERRDVSHSIDIILGIDHESIHEIRPHLQEIKHILMLVSILKRKDLKRNLSKMQQEQYSSLKKVAAYFSKERCSCVIYELKAKILLFITLFRMGYHSPTVREEERLVNLRNRIINLYNKLYSHNTSSMLLSRMSSISLRRSNSQESYIIYDPLELQAGGESVLRWGQSEKVEMQASEELLGKINKFITLNFVGKDGNSKSYLTNLLNILEHELFIFEKNIAQENHHQLSKDYTQHLRSCMGLDRDQQDPNIDIILDIQRLFYLEEYEKAWHILSKQKAGNAQFNVFLERLQSSSSTNNEILKFWRLYNLFEKMDHLMFSEGDKADNVRELTGMANANSLYTISEGAIELIYEIKMRESRLMQLEQFYLTRLSSKESAEGEYRECESFLSRCTKGEIRVYKQERINKTMLRIEIGKGYSPHFAQLTEQFKKFYLFNHIGIFKFNSLNLHTSIQIEIQSNPYILKSQENLFQSKINQFQENHSQKFCRKVLQFIIQVLNLFYDQTQNYLNAEQIILEAQPFSFCINPFYSIIQRIVKIKSQKKKLSRFSISIKNRLMIEKLIQPFLHQFSPCFTAHYFYFLDSLTNIGLKKGSVNTNKLLQLPLFMTMQQKEVFLVYFDNKMSDMCDSFHEQQRKLRKQKKYNEVQKLRLSKMKDPIYKNYSYHFIMGGVLESEMNQLQICSQKQQGRLDWISEHKSLMISYDLPKKEGSQQIKQHAYSLNYLMKYLRGALAHKIQNNYRIILNISQQFPRIFDYLHRYKLTLEAKYDVAIETKNNSLKEFFLLGQKQKNELCLILQGKYQGKLLLNSDVSQSMATLKGHSNKYENKLFKQLTALAYKCQKCNQFINIVKKSYKLFDLLLAISNYLAKKNHFLIQEHNFKDCFLSKYYKSHRVMQIFGLLKKVEAKHYIILNWWFYIETELPCLIICLERIRYTLQS